MAYESGFRWVSVAASHGEGPRQRLIAPSGKSAATVFIKPSSLGKYVWHVWDEQGVGGENSSEATFDLAKITAESAVLRWGKHFRANEASDVEGEDGNER